MASFGSIVLHQDMCLGLSPNVYCVACNGKDGWVAILYFTFKWNGLGLINRVQKKSLLLHLRSQINT